MPSWVQDGGVEELWGTLMLLLTGEHQRETEAHWDSL